jgi:hypothetical protein
MNPFNHTLICGSYFQHGLEESIPSVAVVSNKERAFSIHQTSHIGALSDGVFFSCIIAFCHKVSQHFTRRDIKCTA